MAILENIIKLRNISTKVQFKCLGKDEKVPKTNNDRMKISIFDFNVKKEEQQY